MRNRNKLTNIEVVEIMFILAAVLSGFYSIGFLGDAIKMTNELYVIKSSASLGIMIAFIIVSVLLNKKANATRIKRANQEELEPKSNIK